MSSKAYLNPKFLISSLKNAFTHHNGEVREGISFTDAKNIGILVHNTEEAFCSTIEAFVKKLTDEGKKVSVICYVDNGQRMPYKFKFESLYTRDIDWKGDFKSDAVNKFIKTEFDYLYSINILPILPFENILLKSKAKFRIGPYLKSEKNLFELMISLRHGENIDNLIANMLEFSKKIKGNAE